MNHEQLLQRLEPHFAAASQTATVTPPGRHLGSRPGRPPVPDPGAAPGSPAGQHDGQHLGLPVHLDLTCVPRVLGACHSLELPFVFGTLHDPAVAAMDFTGSGPAADALAARIQDHWLAFVRTGNPGLDQAPWPRWDAVAAPPAAISPAAGEHR